MNSIEQVPAEQIAQRQLDDHGFFVFASTDPVEIGDVITGICVEGEETIPNEQPLKVIGEMSRDDAAALLVPYGWELGYEARFFYQAIAE